MPTFAASTPTILRHPDGQMVALEPGEVLADDDPLVVAYPHLFDIAAADDPDEGDAA